MCVPACKHITLCTMNISFCFTESPGMSVGCGSQRDIPETQSSSTSRKLGSSQDTHGPSSHENPIVHDTSTPTLTPTHDPTQDSSSKVPFLEDSQLRHDSYCLAKGANRTESIHEIVGLLLYSTFHRADTTRRAEMTVGRIRR